MIEKIPRTDSLQDLVEREHFPAVFLNFPSIFTAKKFRLVLQGVLNEEEIPRTESLQDLVERTLPLWR